MGRGRGVRSVRFDPCDGARIKHVQDQLGRPNLAGPHHGALKQLRTEARARQKQNRSHKLRGNDRHPNGRRRRPSGRAAPSRGQLCRAIGRDPTEGRGPPRRQLVRYASSSCRRGRTGSRRAKCANCGGLAVAAAPRGDSPPWRNSNFLHKAHFAESSLKAGMGRQATQRTIRTNVRGLVHTKLALGHGEVMGLMVSALHHDAHEP